MGDLELTEMEVIQDGLIQMDFRDKTTEQWTRCYVDPVRFFSLLGKSMEKNHKQFKQFMATKLKDEDKQ